MAINGNIMIVSLNGTAIAGARTDEAQVACEPIEVSSPTTGTWRQFIAGRKTWAVSTNYLLGAAANVANLLNVGTTYTLTIGNRSTAMLTGTAVLTSCVITMQRGNLVQGSFSFQGSGALAAP